MLTAKKKYKLVALKVKPVAAVLPECFHIVQDIKGDPLAALPVLNPKPPPFTPTSRYTSEHHDVINKAHPPGFLWPAEQDLLHYFMMIHHDAFAWDNSKCSHFHKDFFPPVEIPTIPHTPWQQ